jgi:putative alpha-1,2-mannosidase
MAAPLVSVALGTVAPAGASLVYVGDPASLVNPFIGTSNGGDTFPGADVPFGMVQWSPDTAARPDGGGYSYGDTAITGYALTHLSGPGCAAEGDVPILPTVGPSGRIRRSPPSRWSTATRRPPPATTSSTPAG